MNEIKFKNAKIANKIMTKNAKINKLDRHIRSIHIIRIPNLTIIFFNLPCLTLTLTTQPLLLLLFLLLLLPIILILLLVGFVIQIALLTCIETLILEVSLKKFLNRPSIGELM
jgi:hypothetical protein